MRMHGVSTICKVKVFDSEVAGGAIGGQINLVVSSLLFFFRCIIFLLFERLKSQNNKGIPMLVALAGMLRLQLSLMVFYD
jgi:hypothetical protein